MTTMKIPASGLLVGDLLHNDSYGRHLITRVSILSGRVSVQFDSIPGFGHTFRDATTEVSVDREEA